MKSTRRSANDEELDGSASNLRKQEDTEYEVGFVGSEGQREGYGTRATKIEGLTSTLEQTVRMSTSTSRQAGPRATQ